jgi:hypothetical protein
MTTLAPKNKYSILMRYKSKAQKEQAINEMIDVILEARLPFDELDEIKEDAAILAESLLRSDKNSK